MNCEQEKKHGRARASSHGHAARKLHSASNSWMPEFSMESPQNSVMKKKVVALLLVSLNCTSSSCRKWPMWHEAFPMSSLLACRGGRQSAHAAATLTAKLAAKRGAAQCAVWRVPLVRTTCHFPEPQAHLSDAARHRNGLCALKR